ncbi:DUF6221 family protein [Streptomyces sp. NPDC005246]|uniref:DUF6221 family protein n=1 Tax=Streptomyces sp. NPDC005246 TaxID=3156716 RepID=UPI0033AE37C8
MGRDDYAARVEFLRARLHEDEAAANALKPGKNQDVAKLQARVLADIEAKRRLVDWVEEIPRRAAEAEDNEGRVRWQKWAGTLYAEYSRDLRSPVICQLVAAYDGHRDFHPAWRLVEVEHEDEPGEDKPRTRTQGRTV